MRGISLAVKHSERAAWTDFPDREFEVCAFPAYTAGLRQPVIAAPEALRHSKSVAGSSATCSVILPTPFVDQVGDQSRPTCLVAGAQSHAGVTVVVLVEEQTITPMRIVLELTGCTEAGSLAILIALEN